MLHQLLEIVIAFPVLIPLWRIKVNHPVGIIVFDEINLVAGRCFMVNQRDIE